MSSIFALRSFFGSRRLLLLLPIHRNTLTVFAQHDHWFLPCGAVCAPVKKPPVLPPVTCVAFAQTSSRRSFIKGSRRKTKSKLGDLMIIQRKEECEKRVCIDNSHIRRASVARHYTSESVSMFAYLHDIRTPPTAASASATAASSCGAAACAGA